MTATTTGSVDRPLSAGAWCRPINGFRGAAALIVVVGHTFLASRIFPFDGVIHFISLIVPAFFVVSAYALYRPYIVHHLRGEAPPAARSFWWRRFLRIYPLYAVALTAYLVLLPGVRPHSGSILEYVELYGFLQVYDPDLVTFSGIPAAWFICDEVVFYLMIPFIALGARRLTQQLAQMRSRRATRRSASVLRSHTLIALAMIVVGQVSRTWLVWKRVPGATSLPVSNLDYYGLGILLAVASLRERAGLGLPAPVEWVRRRPWFALAILAMGVGLMELVARSPGATSGPTEDIERYAVYTLMVVPFMTVMCLGDQHVSFNRLFSSKRWSLLALISLHTYLWHQLVLGSFDRYLTSIAGFRVGPRFTTGLVLVIGIAVFVIILSALLRPALDAPYKRWSRLFPRPAGAAPLPRWARPAAVVASVALLAAGAVLAFEVGGSPVAIRGGTGQVTVTHARPGDSLSVWSGRRQVADGTADRGGSLVLRSLRPGRYEVRQERAGRRVIQQTVAVRSPTDHPAASWYEQRPDLAPGLNMITMRDGTQLSAFVTLPGPASKGPYPTVVELSGYRIGDPGETQPASAVAQALGYATVGVNLRGSGCSGGAFDLLGPAQVADGYDVVETVARQDWVRHATVGLVGFSYGGLGALEAASAAPPSLNSVAALSVYGRAWNAFHPGGLANSGFPVGWMQDFEHDVAPSGATWVADRIAGGDSACARNQMLHGQAVDLTDRYLGDGVPDDARFRPLDVAEWAPSIDVPVFLSSQFQDATIGSDLAAQLPRFSKAPVKRLVLTNGTHGDAVSPQILRRMDQFLSLYAAARAPEPFDTADLLRKTRPEVDPQLVPDGPPLPVPVRSGASLAQARTAFAAGPEVEVLFESGGTARRPESAAATTSATFATWPPPAARSANWALRADGALLSDPATGSASSAATFTLDPEVAGDAYSIEGSDLVTNAMSGWTQPKAATAASWVTPPIDTDTALVGDAAIDLWLRTSGSDADVQATLSVIDPSGDETMLQVGWQRASEATIAVGGGRAPKLRARTWTPVRLRFGPLGHLLRAGSRLRLVVGTPGAGQVQWSFYPSPAGDVDVAIGQGGTHSSMLHLPVVPDIDVPAAAPGCGDLRGQPCRRYEPLVNRQVTDGTS